MCVGEQKLTVQIVLAAPGTATTTLYFCATMALVSPLRAALLSGYRLGERAALGTCFSLLLEAQLSAKWALPASVIWLCWWGGGFPQRYPIFSKPKREREKPHGQCEMPLTPQ